MTMYPDNAETIQTIASILRSSHSILFITGAGISADSGLPTYRGIGGLYDREITEEGYRIEDALSGDMLRARPEIAWKYILQIEGACRGAKYNRGHEVIAAFEREYGRVWVLTQNIDGFHHAAGSRNIIDIHGDIHSVSCISCRYHATVPDYNGFGLPPLCPDCGAVIRPDVVLFGERLPYVKLQTLERELDAGFDIVFSVGTTSSFPYIAEPVLMANWRGIPTVEINPGHSEISDAFDFRIQSGAASSLDAIWAALHT